MMATSTLPAVGSLQLDAMLADTLALYWRDLMPELTSGLIHVEPHGSVEFMKVWASTTRGYRDLICEYFMRSVATAKNGFRLPNGYKS